MNIVVDQFRLAIAGILADQVRTAELVVAMDQRDRAAKSGRNMECQRGLAGACGAGKMHCIPHFQIGKRSLGKSLNLRSGHELIAGLSLDGVSTRLDPDDRVP